MQWEEILERAEIMGADGRRALREELQKAVLAALAQKGCFDSIVFQGGTALRLFHGNPRFSNDIDLVLKEGEDHHDLSPVVPGVERFILDNYPFLANVNCRIDRRQPDLQRYVIRTQSDIPVQSLRLHIELASIPSYLNQPRILEFPPIHPAIRVEDEVEILADKVCALAFRSYLKGRDLWDIHYLTKERSVGLNWDLVLRKAVDYGQSPSELGGRLGKAQDGIRKGGKAILDSELERFLPKHVVDQYRPFDIVIESALSLISGTGIRRGECPESE